MNSRGRNGSSCYPQYGPLGPYNQTSMGKYVTQNYLKKLGLEHLKSFATRGVIIDLVKVFQQAGKLKSNPACKSPCIDGGTVITQADLEAGLKLYNVTLREGDAVFLNTGWNDLFKQYPAQNATYNGSEPGRRQRNGWRARR
jgi:Putative cyclase